MVSINIDNTHTSKASPATHPSMLKRPRLVLGWFSGASTNVCVIALVSIVLNGKSVDVCVDKYTHNNTYFVHCLCIYICGCASTGESEIVPGVCCPSAGEFSGSECRKDELMRRRPLLLYRSQLLCWAPLLFGVKQRYQLPVPVPLPGLSDLKRCDHRKQKFIVFGKFMIPIIR